MATISERMIEDATITALLELARLPVYCLEMLYFTSPVDRASLSLGGR